MVVYFAVGDRTDTAIQRMKRLSATIDINDGKASEHQPQIVPNRYARIVRTAMLHCVTHTLKNPAVCRI